jgi:GxxExxY protein
MYNKLHSNLYPHAELTKEVIGAAITVQKALNPGLDEKLYERALCIELSEMGIRFEQQPEFPVHYKRHYIGKLRPDLLVESKLIVDAKVVEAFTNAHEAQMLGYLAITDLDLGLLLNFKTIPLGKKRIIRSS